MPPIVIAGAIAAAGAVGGAVIGSKASGKAADTQTAAANYAADLQAKAAADALAFQKQQFAQGQANIAPWLTSGTVGLQALLQGLGIGNLAQTGTGFPALAPAMDPYAQQRTQLTTALDQLNKLKQGTPLPTTSNPSDILGGLAAITGQALNPLDPGSIDAGIAAVQKQLDSLPAPGTAAQPSWTVTPGQANPAYGLNFGEFTKNFGPEDFTADPGYQFRLSEGNKAIERSAAARGGALSGGAVKAAERYSSGLASQEYQNAFDRYVNQQTNKYNKFASLAGVGQIAANTANAAGQNYANNAGNILMGSANNIGDLATQAANARASGYIGSANAWGGALGNIGNTAMNTILLSQLLRPSTPPFNPNPTMTFP